MDIFCKISMRTSSPPHYPKISHDFPQVIFWFKALGAPFSPSVPERRSGEEEEEPESVINAFVDPPFRAIILLAVRCHRNRFVYSHQLRRIVLIVRHRSKNAWHLPLQLNCIVVFSDDQYGGRLAIHVPFPTIAEADKV